MPHPTNHHPPLQQHSREWLGFYGQTSCCCCSLGTSSLSHSRAEFTFTETKTAIRMMTVVWYKHGCRKRGNGCTYSITWTNAKAKCKCIQSSKDWNDFCALMVWRFWKKFCSQVSGKLPASSQCHSIWLQRRTNYLGLGAKVTKKSAFIFKTSEDIGPDSTAINWDKDSWNHPNVYVRIPLHKSG